MTAMQEKQVTETSSDLRDVEMGAHGLRKHLDATAQMIAEYEERAGVLRDEYAPQIRRKGAEIRLARERLGRVIEAARACFRKPKSRVLHGLTVGLRKLPDRWEGGPEDKADLVKLVRERLPDVAGQLIETVERVSLDVLTDEQRKALGMTFVLGKDVVQVREKGAAIEKQLAALIKDLPKAGRA